jgi:hypothetical protein
MENKIDFDKEIEKAAKEKYIFSEFKTAFIEGAKSEVAKAYHTQGMYSEEEVQSLCKKTWREAFRYGVNENYSHSKLADCNTFNAWFTQNKKK